MKRYIFTILIAAFVFLGFVGQSAADLTVTNEVASVWGANSRVVMVDIAFDSSYAYGGESLTKASRRMASVDRVIILPQNGYTFEYDKTNEKVKVYQPAPPIVYEEQHTISGNSVYLNYPAAYLMNVAQADTNVPIAGSGATVLATTGVCQPVTDFTAGARSGVTFGTSMTGVVYVTYVTQAWKEVWDNLIQNETITISSNSGFTTYPALAIQAISLHGNKYTNAASMIDKDATKATGEAGIDWTITNIAAAGAAASGVSTFAGDVVSTARITYIKKPSSGFLADNFVEEETAVKTGSGASDFGVNYQIMLWSYAGQIPVSGVSTQTIINDRGTTGTNEAYIQWQSGVSPWDQFKMGQGGASTTATYIKGKTGIIRTVPIESLNAADLSALTGVQVIMIGR